MSFNVYFSDPTKAATPIIVEDGKPGNPGNTVDTSLTLLGKNASGYAKAIATNFVQLLENFSSPDAPTNPIEGQLWYDNENKRLKINDSTAGGANWKPLNGIYQQSTQPTTGQAGDLWVDIGKNQVFMTPDGVDWKLVGPNYSDVLKTGPYPEIVLDKFGDPHTVIKNYISDIPVEIISPDSFTPQQVINGFSSIEPGINLNSNYSAKLNSPALEAERLLVTYPYTESVLGNNFVRNDISNSINASLNIQDSLSLGTSPTFVIQKNENSLGQNEFLNTFPGGRFSFKINDIANITQEILKIDGFTQSVGINLGNNSPTADLHVNGNVRIDGQLSVSSSGTVGLTISGPTLFQSSVRVLGTSTFNTSTFKSTIYTGNIGDTLPSLSLGIPAIVPLVDNIYNIGISTTTSVGRRFHNIYAETFHGYLEGNISGSATGLLQQSNWKLSGQLDGSLVFGSASGVGGDRIFDAKLTRDAINSQTSVTVSSATNEILLSTAGVNDGISKITKANFLSDVYGSVVPPGTILPWAGVSPTGEQNVGSIPNNVKEFSVTGNIYNWLLCDGSAVSSLLYPELFSAIKYTYGAVGGAPTQFLLPDMRGRMALGYDNMTNGFTSSPVTPAGRVPEAAQPADFNAQYLGEIASNLSPVVGGSSTGTIGTAAGPGIWNNTTTHLTSVMNPFMAMNFIIKT